MTHTAVSYVIALLVGASYMPQNNQQPDLAARQAVQNSLTLEIGKSTAGQVEVVATNLAAKPSASCNAMTCEWSLNIVGASNTTDAHEIHAHFIMLLKVDDGILVDRAFLYQLGAGANVPLVLVEEQRQWPELSAPYSLDIQGSSTVKEWRAIIHLSGSASASDRQQALSFDFSCLLHPTNCADASSLLPWIRQKS